MKLLTIPEDKYDRYRIDLMFDGYKWDPQWLDNVTVGRHILVLTEAEAQELEQISERLDAETVASEIALLHDKKAVKSLRLPHNMKTAARKLSNYDNNKHIRLMRFDFHPVQGGGYAVSEVNSDVPGGLADATLSTVLAAALFDNKYKRYRDFGKIYSEAIAAKVRAGGRVALVHCSSYSDDRQVMQFVGDSLEALGLTPIYCAADHIECKDKRAFCVLSGYEGEVDCIIRFSPLEWLPGTKTAWRGYFDCTTPASNHAVSLFWQTKACPFAWDRLEKNGIDLSTWKEFLPHTLPPKVVLKKNFANKQDYIFKPAFGRTGEGITIKSAMKQAELKKTMRQVRMHPHRFIAQKMFKSHPIATEQGEEYHVCLGVYTVEGKSAGFYARISSYARIDSSSIEVPVLVEGSGETPAIQSRFEFGRKILETYAPPYARWTNWTRPVPFIFLQERKNHLRLPLAEPHIYYVEKPQQDTAIILDLAGGESVEFGLSLAKIGYRPVVLFNGTRGQEGTEELVPMDRIEDALVLGEEALKGISLPNDAPPAFLLDSNRAFKKSFLQVFDNGWDTYAQDFPTANFLATNGIKNIIVHSDKIRKDLKRVLQTFQKGGISIYITNGFENPKKITLSKSPIKNRLSTCQTKPPKDD